MQLYTNNLQDRSGNAIAGANVLVLTDDGATASIFSDNGITALPNPFQTDADGEFRFYAASGTYSITIRGAMLPADIEYPGIVLFDPADVKDAISPKGFGAVGDGLTDDSAAFAAMFASLSSKTAWDIDLGYGSYRLNSRVTHALAAGSYSFRGRGPSSVILVNNSGGGIQFTSTSRHAYIEVSGINFAPAIAGAGIGFEYSAPEGGVAQRHVFEGRSLTFEPLNSLDSTSYFTEPMRVTGTNRPLLDAITIWNQPAVSVPVLLNLDGCYKPIITDGYVNGLATVGIRNIKAGDNEGFILNHTTVNGADTGLLIEQGADRHPEIWVTDCHLNNKVRGVSIKNSKYIYLHNNLMYATAAADATYQDFHLDGCNNVSIMGNIYRGGGAGDTTLQRRHVNCVNGTRRVSVRDRELAARSSIAPYYADATCQEIDFDIPESVTSFDFASYPARLWELAASTRCYVNTPLTRAVVQNTSGQAIALKLLKQNATPGDTDTLTAVQSLGSNSAGADALYASITTVARSATAGSEAGGFRFFSVKAGVATRELDAYDGVTAGNVAPAGTGTFAAIGNNYLFYRMGGAAGAGIYSGPDAPEGVVSAPAGSIYLRTGATPGMFFKNSGSGSTGWVAK